MERLCVRVVVVVIVLLVGWYSLVVSVIIDDVFFWVLVGVFVVFFVFEFGLVFYGDFVVIEFVFVFDIGFFCFFVGSFLGVILGEVVKFLECVCRKDEVLDW